MTLDTTGSDQSRNNKSAPEAARLEWQRAVSILWEHRYLLVRVTVVGCVLSLAIALIVPRHYTSSVSLMPPQKAMPSNLMAAVGELSNNPVVGNYAGDLLGVKTTGAMFIAVLQSRIVADSLIDKFDLRKEYWDKYYYQARSDLAKNTEMGEDKKSGVITINVTDKDRYRARDLAAEYVAQLNRAVVELNTSGAHRERVFLEKRLGEYKKELDTAVAELGQYASHNRTIGLKDQATAELSGAATLQGQVIAAEAELQGLRQIYGDGNPRVKSANARVQQLRSELQKIVGTESTPSADTQPYPSLRELPVLGEKYQELLRNATVSETVYVILLKQLEMAKVEEAKEVPPVEILDPPLVAERHSRPHRLVLLLAGTLVSLVLAAAYALASYGYREQLTSLYLSVVRVLEPTR
jgi:capsule polysaccharide export protein KpsE/RkpR